MPGETLLSKVPGPVLQALLAGILLPFVVTAAGAFSSAPLIAGSIVVTFFLGKRFFDCFAVPAALVAGLVMTWATGSFHEVTPQVAAPWSARGQRRLPRARPTSGTRPAARRENGGRCDLIGEHPPFHFEGSSQTTGFP